MPKSNLTRTVSAEKNLAARIAYERTKRGWSYETLAERMTDAGCAMAGSATWRIENGDPPRRVTVDELVTLATLFEVDVAGMLETVEVQEQRRAQEVARLLVETQRDVQKAVARHVGLLVEYMRIQDTDSERGEDDQLGRFIRNHVDAITDVPVPPTTLEDLGIKVLKAELPSVDWLVDKVLTDAAELAHELTDGKGRNRS